MQIVLQQKINNEIITNNETLTHIITLTTFQAASLYWVQEKDAGS